MSFLSSRGNSPPVKDPGLGIENLKKLKSQLEREMNVLDQLEASLSDSAQAPGAEQTGDGVRRKLFNVRVGHGSTGYFRVIMISIIILKVESVKRG